HRATHGGSRRRVQEILRAQKKTAVPCGAAVWQRRGLKFRFPVFSFYQSTCALIPKPLTLALSKPAIVAGASGARDVPDATAAGGDPRRYGSAWLYSRRRW